MATFDMIIRGGTVVDGTRVPRYRADIGIKDGKIAKIGRLNPSDGAKVLDASGLIVAPGFIDLHTHFDAQIHWDPYCTLAGWHGVTSVTIGNCGFGFAPVYPKDFDRALLSLARNEAIPLECMKVSMSPDWETFAQWMDHVDRLPLGINVSQLAPVTPEMRKEIRQDITEFRAYCEAAINEYRQKPGDNLPARKGSKPGSGGGSDVVGVPSAFVPDV